MGRRKEEGKLLSTIYISFSSLFCETGYLGCLLISGRDKTVSICSVYDICLKPIKPQLPHHNLIWPIRALDNDKAIKLEPMVEERKGGRRGAR